ncbi:MAG: DNA primase, partial [Planctomycetota bacterium]|nr:DNA primase [Planctomycetota bacterium]
MADLWRGKSSKSNDDVSKVKDACDIVRIIGENLAIKPKGREYVCLCPFHDDHNPSMRIIPAKQIFHCFVCGTGGDVFSFVQKFHKMEFVEALQFLAEKTGVTLTPRRREGSGEQGESNEPTISRRDVLNAAQAASDFYRAILRHPSHGAAARAVVERRGITPEMVEHFQLGAAPDRFDGMVMYANRHNLSEQALLEAGLFKTRDSGGVYDLLRHRLIFPIHDKAGRVVAFGGRKIRDEDEPKYINSPETRLFNKSATLYALHHAARSIQTQRTVLVTEGYMDALACHQGGFTNAVATLGTALTREHASMLRLLCDNVVLLFDGDDAGQRAADRAVPIFFAEPIDVKIATLGDYTDAKDPDELLKREGGAEIFKRVLTGSVDLLEYRFNRVRRSLKGAGVAQLSKAIMQEIESMVDIGLRDVEPIRQRLIVKRLAELGGVDEATIQRALPAGRQPRVFAPTGGDQESASPVKNLGTAGIGVHEHLLGCILCDGTLWAAMGETEKDMVAPSTIEHDELRPLAQVMLDLGEDGTYPSLAAVLAA